MKLTIALLLFAILTATAGSTYSQNTRINLKMKNATLVDVFREIERTSDFGFFFKSEELDLSKHLSIDLKNATIEEILKKILVDNYDYRILDKNIVVTKGSINSTEQQQKSVTGKVTDSTGGGLPGVSVVVKGTTTGTITDSNGNYSISNVPGNAILQFSFVGMKTQEIAVGGKPTINVTLAEDAIGIEEVVAVGYGTQKKANLTGAVGITDSKSLEKRPLANLGQGLQGLIPNLNVSLGDGRPGSGASYNLRGSTSINGGGALVLVDGIQMDPNLLNPDDVESVAVLKDAASAAIYGVRGAFGVVLITTKSGKKDTPLTVTYNGNYGMDSPTRLPNTINSVDFIKSAMAANEAGKLSGGTTSWLSFTDDYLAHIENYAKNPTPENSVYVDPNNVTGKDRYLYCGNTNWVKELYSNAVPHQNHNLTFNGGSKNTNYLVSVGLLNQKGIMNIGDETYKRYNANIKIDSDVRNWLLLNFNTKITRSESNLPASGINIGSNPVGLANDLRPMMPIKHPDGNYSGQGWWTNPFALADLSGRRKSFTNDILVKGGFKLTPAKKFDIIGDFTWELTNSNSQENRKSYYEYGVNGVNLGLYPWTNPASDQESNSYTSYQVANVYGQYENKFGNSHYLKLMAGYNQEYALNRGFSAFAKDLINQDYPSLSLSNDTKPTVGSSTTDWAVAGYFFRTNYSFRDKYLIEVNGRYDGSSRFPSANRFVFQPSVSAGWKINKENFFPAIEHLNELKLRGSFGTLGNQQLSNNYPYISTMGSGTTSHIFGLQAQTYIGAPGLISSNFSWEKVTTVNGGIDWSLFNNRLNGSFDYYVRTTRDMIVAGQPLPAILGTGAPSRNAANLENKGFELSLGWKDQINKDLKYDVTFVLSDYQAKITKYDLNPTGSLSSYYPGYKIGQIWGYETVGFYQSDEAAAAVDNKAIWGGKWLAGDIEFKDLSKDGKISPGKGTLSDPGDKRIIGNSTPRYQYGLNLKVDYKNFYLTAFLQGVAKCDVVLGGPYFWGMPGGEWNTPTAAYVGNYWTPTNTNAYFPRPRYDGFNMQTQTKYLQNGAYMRMKQLSLGYSFSSVLLQKINVRKLDLYLTGQNLFEFTKMYKNFDPEQTNRISYPLYRTVSLGILISL